jgi:hypothetical protein
MCFGLKWKEYDYIPPSCKVRPVPERPRGQDKVAGASLKVNARDSGFECMYGFRYAADNGIKEAGKDPWSLRQTAIYQKFDSTLDKVVWVCIGASKETEKYITEHTASPDRLGITDLFLIHAYIIGTSLASWKCYILDLAESIQEIVRQPQEFRVLY